MMMMRTWYYILDKKITDNSLKMEEGISPSNAFEMSVILIDICHCYGTERKLSNPC
jgi:hypothetical protein